MLRHVKFALSVIMAVCIGGGAGAIISTLLLSLAFAIQSNIISEIVLGVLLIIFVFAIWNGYVAFSYLRRES